MTLILYLVIELCTFNPDVCLGSADGSTEIIILYAMSVISSLFLSDMLIIHFIRKVLKI